MKQIVLAYTGGAPQAFSTLEEGMLEQEQAGRGVLVECYDTLDGDYPLNGKRVQVLNSKGQFIEATYTSEVVWVPSRANPLDGVNRYENSWLTESPWGATQRYPIGAFRYWRFL